MAAVESTLLATDSCAIHLRLLSSHVRPCLEGDIEHTKHLEKLYYDVDELIDVIEGNRKYIKCLYVYNKIDTISIEEVNEISKNPINACISATMELGLDIMLQKVWKALGMVRVYTKRKAEMPVFTEPIILTEARGGYTVKHAIT